MTPSHLEPLGVRALAIGLAMAVALYAIPFTRFVLSYLVIIIHELGHTLVAWLFGYPAIPAFDFFYGGGISFYMEREPLAVMALYAVFALLLYYLRGRPRARMAFFFFILLYSLIAWTPLHRALGVFMGHGAELVVAGVFFYRAASGYGCHLALERPLYAMCAGFIELSALHLAYGLIFSEQKRQEYAAAKGGEQRMDFDVLARDYLGVDVSVIAVVFLLLSLLPPVLSYLYLINRRHVRTLVERLIAWASHRMP